MPTIAELEERIGGLEGLVQQALDRSSRHGQEHWIEGSDPTAIRWQVGAGAPTHEAEEGTPYWDSAANVGYVNSNGFSAWEPIAAGGGGGSAHVLGSPTHTDVSNGTPTVGWLLQFLAGLWTPLPPSSHGAHPTTADITSAAKYEIYLSFGSEREVFSPT